MAALDEQLLKLPDADAHKSLGILESVRRELRSRGGDAFLNHRLLLSSLQRRLASSRAPPTEEVAVCALHVLSDFAGCMEAEHVAGVPAVFSEAVPHLGKDSVRKAAGALVAGMLRRGLADATEASLSQALIARGLKAESVSLAAAGRAGLPASQEPRAAVGALPLSHSPPLAHPPMLLRRHRSRSGVAACS
jgi:hypothetical protein